VSPRFIAIEGIDGAGTTTQTSRLADALRARGMFVHTTREPSDNPIGKLIRGFLAGGTITEPAMALLFAADRLDHLAREVAPALAAGGYVLSDRYVMSSLVYQGELLQEPDTGGFVATVNQKARHADLTLWIDCPAEVALTRRNSRGGPHERYDDLALQQRLARRYAAIAEVLPNCRRIDGTLGAEAVTEALLGALGLTHF
jgi:dTMP kinase